MWGYLNGGREWTRRTGVFKKDTKVDKPINGYSLSNYPINFMPGHLPGVMGVTTTFCRLCRSGVLCRTLLSVISTLSYSESVGKQFSLFAELVDLKYSVFQSRLRLLLSQIFIEVAMSKVTFATIAILM